MDADRRHYPDANRPADPHARAKVLCASGQGGTRHGRDPGAAKVQGKKATLAGKRPLPPSGVATATFASRPTMDTSRSASSRANGGNEANGANGANGGASNKRQRRRRVREDLRATDDVEAAQVLIGLLSGSSDEGDEGDEEGTGDRSDMDVHEKFFGGERGGDTGCLAHAAEMLMGDGATSDSSSSSLHSSSSSASASPASSSLPDSALHLSPLAGPRRPVEVAQQQQQQQQQADLLPSKGTSTEWGMGPREQSKENLEALFAANRPASASLDHDAPFAATSRLRRDAGDVLETNGRLGGRCAVAVQ